MTEQETREKIVEVLKKSREEWEIITPSIGILDEPRVDIEIDNLADALISAGIGDVSELKKHRVVVEKSLIPEDDNAYVLPNIPPTVKQLYSGEEVEQIVKEREEYKHRAEVAERALRNAAPRLKCRGGLGEGFCGVDKCDYYHCNNDEGCVKAHLQQAEKELAEGNGGKKEV